MLPFEAWRCSPPPIAVADGYRDEAVSRSGFGPTTAHLRMETRMGQRPKFINRRSIALALAAWPTVAFGKACPPSRVLFVCPAGTVKSAIAREVLRDRALKAGLAVEVSSRGLTPEDHVSPALAANLSADRLSPGREPALALEPADVAWADIVIAFDGAASSPMLRRARPWRTPSWNTDYAAAKTDLSARTEALVAELRQRAKACS